MKTGQLLKTANIMKQADEAGNIAFLIRKLQSLAEIKTGIHYMEGMAQLQVDLRVCEIKTGGKIEKVFCIFSKIRFRNRGQRRKIIRFHKNSFLTFSPLHYNILIKKRTGNFVFTQSFVCVILILKIRRI